MACITAGKFTRKDHMDKYLVSIGWTGRGAEPWQEWVEGDDAQKAADERRKELDANHPDEAPHTVTVIE